MLGDKTEIGCYCSVLTVLFFFFVFFCFFSPHFHMPEVWFGRWELFKCSINKWHVLDQHTHSPCSRLIDCVEEDKSHQHVMLMAQAYICANDQ